MSWEWSFTTEGEQNIHDNIENLEWSDRAELLAEAYAEIKAYRENNTGSHGDFDMETYESEYHAAMKALPRSAVTATVRDFAFDFRTCDNGGFNAWICPYGCHTVSLDKEEI